MQPPTPVLLGEKGSGEEVHTSGATLLCHLYYRAGHFHPSSQTSSPLLRAQGAALDG